MSAVPTPPRLQASPEHERADFEVQELFAGIVGVDNVSPLLVEYYWKARRALDRQNRSGVPMSPEMLAMLAVLAGCVDYSRSPAGD